MEEYNLTNIICNNFEKLCYIEDNYESVIRYLLDNSLVNLFGNNVIDKDNIDIVTTQNKDGSINIHIETIYRDPVDINITNGVSSFSICGISGEDTVLYVKATDETVANYVLYDEDTQTVKESRIVDFSRNDAKSFSVIRSEDGKDIYQGTYRAILASNGNTEYFDFKHFIYGYTKEKPKNVFKKISDFFHDDAIVTVELAPDTNSLAEQVDVIYNSLTEKLEGLRVKESVKIRIKKNK